MNIYTFLYINIHAIILGELPVEFLIVLERIWVRLWL